MTRVALFQDAGTPLDPAANLDRLASAARTAAARGARLLVAPEMHLTGYAVGPEAVERLAEPADGPSAERAAAIARATGVALAYGYPERAEGGVYNAALLIDRDGRRLGHRKAHLFGDLDRGMFAPGPGPKPGSETSPLLDLDGLRLGLLICYDVEFSEAARALALAGADLLVVPTALMEPHEAVARLVVPARAFENGLFVAYANRCGREGDLAYIGQSCVIGPDGADITRAGRDPALVLADLDPAALRAARAANPYLEDRRPDLYGRLTRPSR